MAICFNARAQDKQCDKSQPGGTLSEGTYMAVERAVEDLNNERYDKAEERLVELQEKVKDYELAIVTQTLGYVYAQRDDLANALAAFEEALSLDALPSKPQENLMLNTGQIYLAEGQVDKGIAMLERYFARACEEPPAQVHIALASAYAEKKRYRDALEQVKLGVLKAEKVQEAWLQLKLALHYELSQLPECGETLLDLIAVAPEKGEYWRQLSGVMLQLENEMEALSVLAIAEREGFLSKENEVRNLANIYLMLNIPYKAGNLLARGIEDGRVEKTADNYEHLSEAWIGSREWSRAESSLANAARLSTTGDLWQRLAQVQMEQENWQGAQQSLAAALEKGVADTAKTNYLMGIAAYYAGNTRQARQAFTQALKDKRLRSDVRQWLDHLNAKRSAGSA